MPHSLETISELLRVIKEDQLPMMHAEVTRRLDYINGTIQKHNQQIRDLEIAEASHKAELKGMKMVIAGIATFFGLLIGFLKLVFNR